MQIQVNTDHNIEGHEALANHVTGTVKSALSRFSDHITRVAIHLSDATGHKNSKDDKHCVIEARLEGRQPIAATHHAETVHQAVNGAADKLARSIESSLGRLHDHKTHSSDHSLTEPTLPDA